MRRPHWTGDIAVAVLVISVAGLVFWLVPAPAHAAAAVVLGY